MQVTVERKSPVEVQVQVSVPKERVASALARAYKTLSAQAQIKGFRKGKVPLPLLKQYFGDRIEAEVSGQLVEETLPRAIEEQKLEPVTQPKVEPKRLEENIDWAYTATMEVRPQLDEVKLEGIELKRQVFKVDDEDVTHQLEHLREEHAELRTPEPARPAKNGDSVTLDYDVSIEGAAREDLKARNRTVEVGKGRLLKELDEGIVGMGVGEAKDISVKFADDHGREDLRGKNAAFKITVSEVREKVLPALDDEFAKDVESDTLDALKAKIRGDLEKQGKEMSEQQLREDAVTALVEKNPIAVPPSLVQNALPTVAREVMQSFRMEGKNVGSEELFETAKKEAEERVRAGLLLAEIARKNQLGVTDADMTKRLEEMSKETGKALARLRAEHRDQKKAEALASAILEEKVLVLLLSKVSVSDVPADRKVHQHEEH